MCVKCKAFVVVRAGKLDPEVVTVETGIQPTDLWRTGDAIAGGVRRSRDCGWVLQSPLGETATMEEHCDALLEIIRQHHKFFVRLTEEWNASVMFYIEIKIYSDSYRPEMYLSSNLVRDMSMCGASVNVELYYVGD